MADNKNKIRKYWDDRAKAANLNPNATTDDVYLRILEIRTFVEAIKKINKKKLKVLDLGCGDGYTTIGIASKILDAEFIGVDYSANMISNANERLLKESAKIKKRMKFVVADATNIPEYFTKEEFDVVVSSRCLINLKSSKQQYKSIADIAGILKKGGSYISAENFEEGNRELNKLRKQMGLNEIPVRWHNLFFKEKTYLQKTKTLFNKVELYNFSSSYYYATRVIYSKFCQLKNVTPDYHHEIHKLAIDLPAQGNFSPIKLVIHKK